MKKKALWIAGLAVLVLAQAVVAWNARLRWRGGEAATDPDVKVRLLRRAEAVYPWNAEVAFELGRVYFSRGAESLGDPVARDRWFRLSVEAFLRSLRLDPSSSAAHFELGQALLYMSYLGLPAPLGYLEEYRRAAELTGHNSQTHYDVGKVLLGRWESLGAEDRDFVAGLLEGALAGKGEERLADFLEAWNLAGRDRELIDRVLPDDAAALRAYAGFLGERALSLDARWSALARAEALDLARARAEIDAARRAADAFRTAEVAERCAAALAALAPVRLYQTLAGRELFAPEDLRDAVKAARRLLALNRIEETRSLADADGTIAAYLALEEDFTALGEFETFLKERGLIEGPGADAPFQDLQALAFRMGLDFKLNRYRDIARTGTLLQSSSLVIAPSGRASYAAVLRLAGEANLKLDNVYEAERFYRLAQEAAPDDLAALLGLARCYGRLNDERRTAEVGQAIARLTGPGVIDLGGRTVAKGGTETVTLVTAGGPRTVRLEVEPGEPGRAPLITVLAGGRVAWEGIGDTGSIELAVEPGPGRFPLEIAAVSGPVRLVRASVGPPTAAKRPN